jgi:short-subunit dehydrogenase
MGRMYTLGRWTAPHRDGWDRFLQTAPWCSVSATDRDAGMPMTAPVRPTVVITGAAGGLGRAIALALHQEGARLLLVDIDEPELRAVELGGAESLVADIACDEGRAAVAARCGELWGAPDVLINNAGVERASDLDSLQPREIRHALEVNLLAPMLLTHALLGAMRQRARGHIINISSLAGIKPVPHNTLYNTAKSGLIGFSLSLSKELAGSGVHATVICPSGVTRVGMWARASDRLSGGMLVRRSTVSPEMVSAAVLEAIDRQPVRILVGSRLVRCGALLSSLWPRVDSLTDRASGIESIYRQRIRTDSDNRL